ncbi:MAG: MBL fold metallo-hydrolase, partial [Deltaproteobacteria bacterium]|nr:MBL fold metallo-hydrolase [Deltaproteobacteria bacterium]
MEETAAKEITSHHTTTEQQRLGLNERLGLIGLIDEGMRTGSSGFPVMADLFNDLWDLVNKTVSGAKIDRLKPEGSSNGFQVFEIKADTGETLGRLNMLYLKKPIPCYYLVYVEVSLPFRRKGLGNRVLEYFRDFLVQKSAVGILDNIIPGDDPTYDIYFRQAWEPVTAIIGEGVSNTFANYMVYVPPRLQKRDLREPVMKLLHHLKRKRAAIDMRDNEFMVQRTISEFKDLHAALVLYFEDEIQKGASTPLMRFMFTRFVTKLIAFRRRIGDLLGYTGGESMEQIVLAPEIAELPVQSYAPPEIGSKSSFVTGDRKLWPRLPEDLRKHPARIIESLPNYRRPSLINWLKDRGKTAAHALKIGDLMDLGFDPTRLKEITIDGDNFIFERVQARQIPDLEKKKVLLERMASKM